MESHLSRATLAIKHTEQEHSLTSSVLTAEVQVEYGAACIFRAYVCLHRTRKKMLTDTYVHVFGNKLMFNFGF